MPGAALAFAWRTADGAAQALRWSTAFARRPGWRREVVRTGLEVWTETGGPAVAEGPAPNAVWVGRCAGANVPVVRDPERPSSTAQRVLRETWGGYLLLLADREGGWQVLRDPSGALEALTWRRGDLAVLATALEPMPPWTWPSTLALDWAQVADVLRRPASLTAATPLSGIHTVAPGDLQPLGEAPQAAEALWRPLSRALAPAPSIEVARETLSAAVDVAVTGMVAPHARCMAEVSGGLDSTIVSATLASAPGERQLSLAHVFVDLAEADERAWAMQAQAAVRAPIDILNKAIAPLTLEDFTELARGARPALNALDPGRDRLTRDLLVAR